MACCCNATERIWAQRNNAGNDGGSFSITTAAGTPPTYGDEPAIAPFFQALTRPFTPATWNISQLNLLDLPTNDLEIVDDRNISTGALIESTDDGGNGNLMRNLGTQSNRLGANWDLVGLPQYFNGDIAEVIVYDRPISGAERAQVFSYLALKYGITIKTDLVSSGSSTVWNATANSTYNNNVFGLAIDNGAGLAVTQSNSIATGSGNGAGQNAMANVVLSNPSLSTDQTFLIVGNDAGPLTETGADVPAAASGSMRLGREWKVQATGNAGVVQLSIDLNGLAVSGTTASDFRLIVDEDGNGDFSDGSTRYYSASGYSGGIVSFNLFGGVRLNNNEVFALITAATLTTPLPVTWKSFDAKVNRNDVQLSWEVGNNESADKYLVEHSVDGINFKQVGSVANQKGKTSYSFTYASPAGGKHYFRLRQVDLDGKAIYSKTVSVKLSNVLLRLINNPTQARYIDIEINALKSANAFIELHSVTGAAVSSLQKQLTSGTNIIRVPMDKAAAGNYVLKVKIDDEIITERVIKL